MRKLWVEGGCKPRCVNCSTCPTISPRLSGDNTLNISGEEDVHLCGGDVTAWSGLGPFLKTFSRLSPTRSLWIDAPATPQVLLRLEELQEGAIKGVSLFVQAHGGKMAKAFRSEDALDAIKKILNMSFELVVRLGVRPETFSMVAPVARGVFPVPVELEVDPSDFPNPNP